MKIKKSKALIMIIASFLILVSAGILTGGRTAKADDNKATAIILAEALDKDDLVLTPGKTKHMRIPIKAIGGYMNSAYVSIEPEGEVPFTFSQIILSDQGDGTPAYGVHDFGKTYVEFDVNVKETATIDMYPVVLNVTAIEDNGEPYTLSLKIYFQIIKELKPSQISLSEVMVKDTRIANDTLLLFRIRNEGEMTALNTYVSLNYGETNITPLYETPKIFVGDLEAGKDKYMSLPIRILPTATEGLKTVTLNVEYKNIDGEVGTNTHDIFVDIKKNQDSPDIAVESVTFEGVLEPEQAISMKVILQNYGETQARDITVKIDETSAGYGPEGIIKDYFTESIWVGNLKPENTREVVIPLKVSKQSTGGIKILNLNIDYIDENGTAFSTKSTVYPEIIVEDEEEDQVSKPKLIVSKYSTDVEELRAGSTFNFIFDIHNTHSSVAAKNITVTVSQAENIFSPTQGSNSFFISRIEAGETVQKSLEMKVKADATTKAYPLKLTIEYEYDGIEANPTTGEVGETRVEELNLQAVENSRPVVDYVNVYSWDGNVMVGNPATLSFEFYNMGKSPLNNVIATVEGDFTKSDGNMYFIGTVDAGSASFVEFDVIPNVEGTAKGILHITFEDSNGDEIKFDKEFETMVQGAMTWDPGMEPGIGEEVFNPDLVQGKKEILPLWLFIIIQVAIFIVFMPVSRKVIIQIYKAKLRRAEYENN